MTIKTHIAGSDGHCAHCALLLPRVTREEKGERVTVPLFPGDHVGIIESAHGQPSAYLVTDMEHDSNEKCTP